MSTRIYLLIMLLTSGCIESDVDAGFSITWAVTNSDGAEIACADAGASTVEIRVTDSDGVQHTFREACDAYTYETDDWSLASGEGRVTMTLRAIDNEVVSVIDPFSFNFRSGQIRNDIGLKRFDTGVEGGIFLPRITWYWRIMDDRANFIQCNQVGATFLRFSIIDAESGHHHLGTIPCRIASSHSADATSPIAPGPARYTVEFLNRNQDPVGAFEFDIRIPDRPGDLEISIVTLEATPMGIGGDAGITWEWRYGSDYFTEETCDTLGIDYVKLWVWHEPFDEWWTDQWGLRVRCQAFNHASDNALFGDEPYSGLFVDSLLDPGDYRMFLGFYASASEDQPADVLVFYDEVKGVDGRLLPNTQTPSGTNLFETLISPDEMPKTGALKVALEWTASEDDMVTTCEGAEIYEMGFALRNSDLLISELEFGTGQPCRDWLEFASLPVLDEPYDLIVSGISLERQISYYTTCSGLVPEPDTPLEEANGIICRITP